MSADVNGDYEIDLFYSYKREPAGVKLTMTWQRQFSRRLEYYVRQELGGKKLRTFRDVDDVRMGRRPWKEIAWALGRSKCLLALVTPEYFESPFCRAELQAFRDRCSLLEKRDGSSPPLVLPVILHRGDGGLAARLEYQYYDLSGFFATTPAFWSTSGAVALDRLIRDHLAPDVAAAIRQAPPYEEWPIAGPEPAPGRG